MKGVVSMEPTKLEKMKIASIVGIPDMTKVFERIKVIALSTEGKEPAMEYQFCSKMGLASLTGMMFERCDQMQQQQSQAMSSTTSSMTSVGNSLSSALDKIKNTASGMMGGNRMSV